MNQKFLELPKFRSDVWNLFSPTDVRHSVGPLRASIKWGCTLWLCNEAPRRERVVMFEDHGLKAVQFDQHLIGWDPNRWELEREWHDRLSPQHYYATGKTTPKFSESQAAVLVDKLASEIAKRKIKVRARTYHTPAAVQQPNPSARRFEMLLDSKLYLAADAHAADEAGEFPLFGGDDNYDEINGLVQNAQVANLIGPATGLRQVQAPAPTLGNLRKIDDYHILMLLQQGNLKPTGVAEVANGGGTENPAHKMHLREWEYFRVRAPIATQHPCPDCGLIHSGVVKH